MLRRIQKLINEMPEFVRQMSKSLNQSSNMKQFQKRIEKIHLLH